MQENLKLEAPVEKPRAIRKRDKADADNREAAAIILADPKRYGPGMVAWAEKVRERLGS